MRATRGAEVRYKQKQKQTPVHRGRGGTGRHGEGRDRTGQHGADEAWVCPGSSQSKGVLFNSIFVNSPFCVHQMPYRCEGYIHMHANSQKAMAQIQLGKYSNPLTASDIALYNSVIRYCI